MATVLRSSTFDRWMRGLRDKRAKGRISARIDRLAMGNAGDARPVGSGISELRIHIGPGYRVYYEQDGDALVLLLCGGDKSSQSRDIAQAHRIHDEWRRQRHE